MNTYDLLQQMIFGVDVKHACDDGKNMTAQIEEFPRGQSSLWLHAKRISSLLQKQNTRNKNKFSFLLW